MHYREDWEYNPLKKEYFYALKVQNNARIKYTLTNFVTKKT